MSNSIFFNVSTNDVEVNENTLNPDKAWEVFKNYRERKRELSLPVISPYLEEFEKVERLYLIVTEGMEKGLRASLNHGLVIKRKIEETYGKKIQVNIWELGRSPDDIRSIYDFYADKLGNLESSGRKIFSLSRGTPVMDAALFIHASTIFNNVELYQREPKSERFTPLPHKETVRKLLTKQSIQTLINQGEYGAALNLLEKESIPGREKLVHLLDYGRQRLYFNFEGAKKAYSELESHLSSIERKELGDLFTLEVKDLQDKLIELGWNTIVKLERQEYVDFVGRLFRFQEALAEYVFESETGQEIDWESKTEGNRDFRKTLWNYPDLVEEIRKEVKLDLGENLENLRINTTVLHVCFRYFVKKDGERWGQLWEVYKKSRRIVDNLRHYTIVAHGFQGVSKERIEAELEGENLNSFEEDIQHTINHVAGEKLSNPFNRINRISQGWLQKM
ncbi:hypothetical protein KGY71_01955 [Candidatus Bipolaricaulota bacterium]|nr:hypothetical protein [Candidatus Bipolaricaulota bacterium]